MTIMEDIRTISAFTSRNGLALTQLIRTPKVRGDGACLRGRLLPEPSGTKQTH